ncbi:hypothetical protein ACSBR2_014443 [Camellia fascicularis]
MARPNLVMLFMFILMCASLVSYSHGRKLVTIQEERKKRDSLYQNALPKGTTPPSSPSKRGHADMVDEKLFGRHLAAIDRILSSVPSPGVGH